MKRIVLAVIIIMTLTLTAGAVAPEYHTIVKGDTLHALAENYQVTIVDFLDFNPGITPDRLNVGQKLLIPVEPIWSYHVVQQGDNTRSLATQYKVPEDLLRVANGLSNNKLKVDEMIRIPIHFYLGEVEQTTHTVEIGDTLYKIAHQYEVTLSQLIEWNKLTDINDIVAGEILVVG